MTAIRNTLFALGFVSLGVLGTASLTAAADDGEERRRGHPMQTLLEGVELTDAQQTELEEMKEDMKAERDEHRAERADRMETLVDMLEAKKVDRQEVYDAIDEKLAGKRELLVKRADLMMDFIETLDEDQKAQVLENLSEVEAKRAERSESGGEGKSRRPRGH